DLAKLGVRLHHAEEAVMIQRVHFAGLAHAYQHEAAPCRQHVDLAGKHAWLEDGDRVLGGRGGAHDFDLPGDHHIEVRRGVTPAYENLADADTPPGRMTRDARNLVRSEDRKHLCGAFAGRRGGYSLWSRIAHESSASRCNDDLSISKNKSPQFGCFRAAFC